MRSTRLSLLCALALSFTIIGCGGGGDDDGGGMPDAMQDAMQSTPLTGLGQKCVAAMQGADCPTNAPGCLTFGGAAMGICTTLCVTNGTMMTNPQAQIASVAPDPRAPAQVGICTGIFTGTVGAAACVNLIPGFQPADNPLQANKQYTNVQLTCGIACGAGNTCPGGLTCTGTQCVP